LSSALLVAAGCGGVSRSSNPAQKVERQEEIAVSHALKAAQGQVAREVAQAKVAWPLVASGLPASASSSTPRPIAAAAQSAASIRIPVPFQEAHATSLTGPAAGLAGLFRIYTGLTSRGWQLIDSSLKEREHGSPAAARFARENVALYIESVYDGHFSLAQIGKQLEAGYDELGGSSAFGNALTQAEVDALAGTYSEAADRLHPHVRVRLGS
jgi:hypothetical protein